MTTQEAIDHLKKEGYYVDNLWSRRDVTNKFHCAEEIADEILEKVLNDEWMCDNIQAGIHNHAQRLGLKQKEE
jgi:hypothetical protein